jgi:hypothetical protein
MKKTALIVLLAALTAASSARAEVNVNVNLGVPVPRVIVSGPPAGLFGVAPLFVAPSRLGFYVGVDTPYDIIFSSDFYYLYYGNSWHRSRHHNGPWIEVPYRELPPGIRKHRIEQIRTYRDREYRVYRNDRDHYRGRSFRPEHERKMELKDERRHDRQEIKEERRQDREEWKDNRRGERQERKEDNRDRRGHGRD